MAEENKDFGQFPMFMAGHQTDRDRQYYRDLESHFATSLGNHVDRLHTFTKFVPRADLSRFLVKDRLFNQVLDVHGYIVECGVFLGGGLMSWAQLSSIHEPLNHVRRVVGFDTFEGFAAIHEKDAGASPEHAAPGGLKAPVFDELRESIRLYDLGRPIGHIPRVELVKGDALKTIPAYVKENPHLVVALLYLDFDLYEPTKAAIQAFRPLMPKGSIIAFDELNQKAWPGETIATHEVLGISNLRLRRFPFQPQISYAVLE